MRLLKQHQSGFSLFELMIALFLSAVLCVGIFSLLLASEKIHRQERAMTHVQSKVYFLSSYLRDKIRMAGDASCDAKGVSETLPVVQRFDADAAKQSLGVSIQSGTQLLLLKACVRFHQVISYLPLLFFVADTHRVNHLNQKISALFVKIADQRREEMITGVRDFQINLFPDTNDANHILAVQIDYLISSVEPALTHPQHYWFVGKNVTASDSDWYQSGVLYAAVRAGVT